MLPLEIVYAFDPIPPPPPEYLTLADTLELHADRYEFAILHLLQSVVYYMLLVTSSECPSAPVCTRMCVTSTPHTAAHVKASSTAQPS